MDFSRKQTLFFILSGFFIANAVLAEIIGTKIFSVEATLGLPPAKLLMPWGDRWSFNQSAGALNWPLVFIIGDLINEYFGKAGVRRLSFFTAGLIVYVFIVIYVATHLPPAGFWLEVNRDAQGFDINEAFSRIFRQGLGIIIGSISAFILAQLLDVSVFQWLRKRTGHRHIWLRATGSTVVSQLIDSFVVVYVAFFVFGNWSLGQAFSVSLNNYLYKFIVAILMTPLLYLLHYLIDAYLGKEAHRQLPEDPADMPAAL